MSAGPIAQERRGHLPPEGVPRGEAVCARSPRKGHGFCGLSKPKDRITDDWDLVDCPECGAARRADEEAARS